MFRRHVHVRLDISHSPCSVLACLLHSAMSMNKNYWLIICTQIGFPLKSKIEKRYVKLVYLNLSHNWKVITQWSPYVNLGHPMLKGAHGLVLGCSFGKKSGFISHYELSVYHFLVLVVSLFLKLHSILVN